MNHQDQTPNQQQDSHVSAGNQPANQVDMTRRGSLAVLAALALAGVGAAKPYSKPAFLDESEMEPEPGSRIR